MRSLTLGRFARRGLWLSAVLLGMVVAWCGETWAIAPRYISDVELAKYPIIVVAQWEKAPFKANHRYVVENAIDRIESYTRLKILSVVKGKVEPGEHELLVGWGIGWQKDGTGLESGTSSQMLGEVADVTKPCLWFLERARSWDEKRKDEYLSVSNYREVQPVELKAYYEALGGRDAEREVPKLLSAKEPDVAFRVLRYISGEHWPWPYESFFPDELPYDRPAKRGKLLRAEADRVWEYLQSDAKDIRPFAAAVYADLVGKEGVAKLRTLLDDKDPDVRGVGAAVLARHRDADSLDRFAAAVADLDDASFACQLIKELAAWKDERAVPTLIGFLQNDDFAYQHGDDLGVPALKAHVALKEITGHEFPYDVETSRKAWQEAVRIADRAERAKLLEKAAPGSKAPLVATAVGIPTKEMSESLRQRYEKLDEDEFVVAIRVRNLSARPVTVLKVPSEIEFGWPGGHSSRGSGLSGEREREFATIEPKDDVEVEAVVNEDFLVAEPRESRLTLSYLANGKSQGATAWIGTVQVQFGEDWKYNRTARHVEETWPNGNLKATGTTVNGKKLGEWNYFNEAGDRIRIEYPGTGRGTAICSPEHPENKGAGKREGR